MSRILLVEDDESLGQTLKLKLEREGATVFLAGSKQAATAALGDSDSVPFDCCILDVGLPDGSGLDLGRDLRLRSEVPIIFLSAMSSAEYRLEGFELGADDYVPKPFHFKELYLRVRKALESRNSENKTTFSGFKIDAAARALIDDKTGEQTFLNEIDLKLLIYLIQQAPRAVPRDELLSKLWGQAERESARTVDNAIVRIRQALKDHHHAVKSVRGIGYQFIG